MEKSDIVEEAKTNDDGVDEKDKVEADFEGDVEAPKSETKTTQSTRPRKG